MRTQIATLGLSDVVEVRGLVDHVELLRQFQRCQVVALFSHEETLPTVLAQALAVGKPVVASHVGGVPELVDNGQTGFLVDAGDERRFAERLSALLAAPELCVHMGAEGRRRAQRMWAPLVIADQTVDAYRRAIFLDRGQVV